MTNILHGTPPWSIVSRFSARNQGVSARSFHRSTSPKWPDLEAMSAIQSRMAARFPGRPASQNARNCLKINGDLSNVFNRQGITGVNGTTAPPTPPTLCSAASPHFKASLEQPLIPASHLAAQREIDIDLLRHLENKDAGVLEPPLDVRNREVALRRQVRAVIWICMGKVRSCGVPCNVNEPDTWIVESPGVASVPW